MIFKKTEIKYEWQEESTSGVINLILFFSYQEICILLNANNAFLKSVAA